MSYYNYMVHNDHPYRFAVAAVQVHQEFHQKQIVRLVCRDIFKDTKFSDDPLKLFFKY